MDLEDLLDVLAGFCVLVMLAMIATGVFPP